MADNNISKAEKTMFSFPYARLLAESAIPIHYKNKNFLFLGFLRPFGSLNDGVCEDPRSFAPLNDCNFSVFRHPEERSDVGIHQPRHCEECSDAGIHLSKIQLFTVNEYKAIKKLFCVFLALLSACSTTTPTGYVGKKYWHSGSERPYMMKGVMYYPQIHYQYAAIGEASWYGYDCHGKPTAIGRKFDKNKLTAAHRTLPLPSIVLVENLENGKKIKLLVNDRGPFARTNRRIIDVTQRAAELLGFRNKGFAKVKVTCLPRASRMTALTHKRKPY